MEAKETKVLVTGGAGFIGSHVVDELILLGYQVFVIDDLSTGKKKNINPKAKFYKASIENSERIFEKEKPEIVFHFAAQASVAHSIEKPVEDAKNNIIGTINLLENCRKYKVKKFIFSSSAAVYGKPNFFPTPENFSTSPDSPYGIAKLSAEEYLQYYYKAFGLNYLVFRFSNVYGPRQNVATEAGVVAAFCQKILSKKTLLIYGDGNQTRDFVYVADIAKVMVLSIKGNATGIFNISTGKEAKVNDIFDILKKQSALQTKEQYVNDKNIGAERSCLDCSKARKEFNWQSTYGIEEGLRLSFSWFKNNYGKK